MNSSSGFNAFGQHPCGGASRSAAFIQMPVRDTGGAGGILSPASPNNPLGRNRGQGVDDRSFGIGGVSPEPIHNFSNDSANTARLVCVDLNRSGIARLFNFIPSFHATEITHATQ